MDSIKKAIDDEREHLFNIRKRAVAMLAKVPEGALIIHGTADRKTFYARVKDISSGKPVEKYLKRDGAEILPYIRKYCSERVIRIADKGLDILSERPYDYDDCALQNEYRRFESLFGKLTPKQFITKDTIIKRWQEGPYEKSTRPIPEDRRYVTDRGETVRSKNEALCANCLARLGIPYHYEEILRFKDGTQAAPDFTIFSPKDSEIYIIEVMGMMSDSKYLEDNSKKIEKYARNGYIPGDNLLLFFEFADMGLDLKLFEDTVTGKFLS